MRYSFIIGCSLMLWSNFSFGQFLKEQEWASLSDYMASDDTGSFEKFLEGKGFLKSDEAHDKYKFYTWKKTDGFFYGVRVNKKSKQVTYMTNDHNYVLRLFSRFISEYSLINSERKGQDIAVHTFQSETSTIVIKLDISPGSGVHLLLAVNK